MICQTCRHRWRSRLPHALRPSHTQRPHWPAEVVAQTHERAHRRMHLPVFREPVRPPYFPSVPVPVRPVKPLQVRRVDLLPYLQRRHGRRHRTLLPIDYPRFHRHDPALFPFLVDCRLGQFLRYFLIRLRRPTGLARSLRYHLSKGNPRRLSVLRSHCCTTVDQAGCCCS